MTTVIEIQLYQFGGRSWIIGGKSESKVWIISLHAVDCYRNSGLSGLSVSARSRPTGSRGCAESLEVFGECHGSSKLSTSERLLAKQEAFKVFMSLETPFEFVWRHATGGAPLDPRILFE